MKYTMLEEPGEAERLPPILYLREGKHMTRNDENKTVNNEQTIPTEKFLSIEVPLIYPMHMMPSKNYASCYVHSK